MSEKKGKVIAVLDNETREKLEFICKRDKRAMSNMVVFLIDDYYNRVVEKSGTKENKYDVKKVMELQGSGWDGDLEKSRANREFE